MNKRKAHKNEEATLSPFTKKMRTNRRLKTEKIKNAINTLEPKIKSRDLTKMIKSVCPSPSQCLVLSSEYIPHFHKLFSNFSDFSMLSPNHPRQFMNISSGANGFVNEIYYSDKTGTYTTSAIIKSGYTKTPNKIIENVTYEGLVGMFFINEEMYKFPCFIETYGIFNYEKNTALKEDFSKNDKKNYKPISPEFVNDNLRPIFTPTIAHKMIKPEPETINVYATQTPGSLLDEKSAKRLKVKRTLYNTKAIRHALNDSADTAIAIQHIPDANDLYEHFLKLLISKNKKENPHIMFELNEELATLFFQIYSVLSHLSDKFTHNDLHYGNALIYSLQHKYVKMVYHMENKTVEFYTNKIMKIIDYGRCHVSGDAFSSTCFYKSICKMEKMAQPANDEEAADLECNPDEPTSNYETNGETCGKSYGLTPLWKTPKTTNEPYISAVQRNKSADLLLLQRLHSLLLNYIYKYEYVSANELPEILNYIESPMYTLLNKVYNTYRAPVIDKILKDYVSMLLEIQASLTRHNHPIVEKYNVKTSNLNELYSVYRSREIIVFLNDHDAPLSARFMRFNNSKINYENIATIFSNYKFLVDEGKKYMNEELKKSTIMTNLLLNNHLSVQLPYTIKEHAPGRNLNTVNAVSFYLESYILETGVLNSTRQHFETSLHDLTVPYEYIGELHVYIDGSGKSSHFVSGSK